MRRKKTECEKLRGQITKVSNALAQKIIDKMVEGQVGIIVFRRGETDAIYSFMAEQDYLMTVGAVIIPKSINGERWVGVISNEDIQYSNNFSFLRENDTMSLEWLDEVVDTDINTAGANIDWLNNVYCVDDECLFPVDTYYQISEGVENILG